MNLDDARNLLHKNMENQNLRRHCYAVSQALGAFFDYFKNKGKNPPGRKEDWQIIGLLHDADYELTKDAPAEHTKIAAQWLEKVGFESPEQKDLIRQAILSHNFSHTGENPPANLLENTLYCLDELTGLIVAVALVHPGKKLDRVSVESVLNKWSSKAFAAAVKREQIEECEQRLGIPLEEFIGLTLKAMQEISDQLGL